MQWPTAILIIPLMALGLSGRAQSTRSSDVLTNRAVVALAGAGFGEDFLIDLIRNSRTEFDNSAEGLASLAKQGLSERIIGAMVEPRSPMFQPRAETLAVSKQTPRGGSRSLLQRLFRRKAESAVSEKEPDLPAPHLGTVYGAALSTGPFVPIAH